MTKTTIERKTPLQNSLLKQISLWWSPPISKEYPLLYSICSASTRSESVPWYIASGTSEENPNFSDKNLASLCLSHSINPIHTYGFQNRHRLLTTNHPTNIVRKIVAAPGHGRVFRTCLSSYSSQLQNDRHPWYNYDCMSSCHLLPQTQATITTVTTSPYTHHIPGNDETLTLSRKTQLFGVPHQPYYLFWKGTRNHRPLPFTLPRTISVW